MKYYLVMIDDDVSSKTFTFDELLDDGILDNYDEHIKVKATEDTLWYVARDYPFYISEAANPNYVVNDDGTVTRIKKTDPIRPENSSASSHNTDNRSSHSNSVSTSNSSSPKSEDSNGCLWAVIIGIGIIILASIFK